MGESPRDPASGAHRDNVSQTANPAIRQPSEPSQINRPAISRYDSLRSNDLALSYTNPDPNDPAISFNPDRDRCSNETQ